MPLIDRPLVISERPTLVDPINGEDDEEVEETPSNQEPEVRVIGEGGGKTVHGIEFEETDQDLIKGANLVAMLATGDEGDTQIYREIFTNAAIQLKRAEESGKDISTLVTPSQDLNAHTIGVVWGDGSEDEEPDSADDEQPDSVEPTEDNSDEETTEE